jgi:hypothetical protein
VSTKPLSPISEAREKLGLQPEAVASAVQITTPHYYDVENHQSELFHGLSLKQVILLSHLLHVPLQSMFSGERSFGSSGRLMDLAVRVAVHCKEAGLGTEAFGDQVGWDIQRFVHAPATALEDWCVDTLRVVCSPIRFSWIDVLTNEAAA